MVYFANVHITFHMWREPVRVIFKRFSSIIQSILSMSDGDIKFSFLSEMAGPDFKKQADLFFINLSTISLTLIPELVVFEQGMR